MNRQEPSEPRLIQRMTPSRSPSSISDSEGYEDVLGGEISYNIQKEEKPGASKLDKQHGALPPGENCTAMTASEYQSIEGRRSERRSADRTNINENVFSDEFNKRSLRLKRVRLTRSHDWTGFKFSSIRDVERSDWELPAIENIRSTFVLRILADIYFNEPDLRKARPLLRKLQESGYPDADISMMLLECEFALAPKANCLKKYQEQVEDWKINMETKRWEDIVYRLRVPKGGSLKIDDAISWEFEMYLKHRYIGIMLLRYYTFQHNKNLETRPDVLRKSSTRRVRVISLILAQLQADIYNHDKRLITIILEDLLVHIKMDKNAITRRHAYTEAFCENCIAWCYLSVGNCTEGLPHVRQGINIMLNRYREGRKKRLLFANLRHNEFIAFWQKKCYVDAWKAAQKAAYAYEAVADHRKVVDTHEVARKLRSYAKRCLSLHSTSSVSSKKPVDSYLPQIAGDNDAQTLP